MDKNIVQHMIDESLKKALSFAAKKYGDTPTDALQLTPKKYVDANSGGNPAGSDTQVQFNDGGSFGADTNFTFNKTGDALFVGGTAQGWVIGGGTATISARDANQRNIISGFAGGDLYIAPGVGVNSQGGPSGRLFLGQSSVDSAAPKGLVYINTVTGTPSVISTTTDYVPLIYDTSANKLWAFNGSWRSVTFT